MAYEKRVYTPGEEVVTYEDMNRIEEGIFNNEEAITALEDKNTEQDTAISEKVKVNGTATNVNFIEKKVVQEGLVKQFNNNTSLATDETANISSTSVIDVSFYFTAKDNSGTYTEHQIINFGDTTYISVKRTDMKTIRFITGETVTLESSILDKKIKMRYVNDGTNAKLFIDDKLIISSAFSYTYTSIILRRTRNLYLSCCAYNRVLTPQEVNHHFNVLNSTPSINKINSYAISTDTDHVTDRGNISQETINRTFYKQFCKEFTSDGSGITVNNGMDGYVLSGEIKGQTVKCVADKNIKTTLIQSSTKTSALTSKATDTNAKIYTYVFYASRIVGTPKVQLTQSNDAGSAVSVVDAKLGINTKTFTSNISDIGKIGLNSGSSTDAEIDIDYVSVVEGNASLSGYVPFGLNSTKAIIQNNGVQYPVYATQADKTSNIPISLGGVGGVYDTLTLNEDGSGVYTQNSKSIVLNGSEDWKWVGLSSDSTKLRVALSVADMKTLSNGVCDKFKWVAGISTTEIDESLGSHTSSTQIHCVIKVDKLTTANETGFKAWLQANPLTVRYQLATPVTTTITKELMPTILTTKANAINLNSVVKASSLKVSLPVDRITELQSQVTALQNAVLLLQS